MLARKIMVAIAAIVGICADAPATTPGWENICATREEFPASEKVWQADFSQSANYKWELREGATGSVEFSAEGVRIRKTNDEGYILVTAPAFKVKKGERYRFTADHVTVDADVDYASGVLRYYGSKEPAQLGLDRRSESQNFWGGGLQTMRGFPCSAPGMRYRKYGQCIADEEVLTPVIIVSGSRSTSTWSNWYAEELGASQNLWHDRQDEFERSDYRHDRMDEAEFDKRLAADTQHTAVVERRDGVSRLVVDGKIVAPSVYKACHRDLWVDDKGYEHNEQFAGKVLDGSAVKIMVKHIYPCYHCEGDGSKVDIPFLASQIKSAMRCAPDSYFVVAISGNAPKDFIQKYHPEEAWLNEAGQPVIGMQGSCIIGYLGSTKETFKQHGFIWPSPASRVWRDWVKGHICDLVAELKRQHLDKRIVGIHIYGYHDGQFSVPYIDSSACAKAEYEKMLAEPGCLSTNYAFCCKQMTFRAQEEFVREFKQAMGKPTIGVMWCESPFQGARNASLDLTSFCLSDAMDVVVCQPNYRERQPGFPTVSALPLDSLHLHGKMFWNEYDYRTYAPVKTGDSPVSFKSLGGAEDFPMWQSQYRKVVGEANATRMGYWLYDMSGGWYRTPAIAADIRRMAKEEELFAQLKPSAWKPEVAVVLDEEQILQQATHPLKCITAADEYIYASSCRLFGVSGVPYSRFLAHDVLAKPELLDGKKMVIIAFFREIDAKRQALLDRLAAKGVTLVYLSESGVRGGAEVTRFKPIFKKGTEFSLHVVPEAGVKANVASLADTYCMRERNVHSKVGERCAVEEGEGVKVLARYADDKLPAIAVRKDAGCRRVYVAAPGALTPELINRFAQSSGAYAPVNCTGLQVDMNGDMISVHCLKPGHYDFRLPFDCRVMNMKNYTWEATKNGVLPLDLTAGETCRFRLVAPGGEADWERQVAVLKPLDNFASETPAEVRERGLVPFDPSVTRGTFTWVNAQGVTKTRSIPKDLSWGVPSTRAMTLHGGGMISARVKFDQPSHPEGKPQVYDGICMKNDEFLLGRTNDRLYFNLMINGKWQLGTSKVKIPLGRWVEVAVKVTKGEKAYDVRYYLDGAEVDHASVAFGERAAPSKRRNLILGTCWGEQWLIKGELGDFKIVEAQ